LVASKNSEVRYRKHLSLYLAVALLLLESVKANELFGIEKMRGPEFVVLIGAIGSLIAVIWRSRFGRLLRWLPPAAVKS
jgi:hypothetical protein